MKLEKIAFVAVIALVVFSFPAFSQKNKKEFQPLAESSNLDEIQNRLAKSLKKHAQYSRGNTYGYISDVSIRACMLSFRTNSRSTLTPFGPDKFGTPTTVPTSISTSSINMVKFAALIPKKITSKSSDYPGRSRLVLNSSEANPAIVRISSKNTRYETNTQLSTISIVVNTDMLPEIIDAFVRLAEICSTDDR